MYAMTLMIRHLIQEMAIVHDMNGKISDIHHWVSEIEHEFDPIVKNILMGQVLSPKGQDLVKPRIWHSESATDCFLLSPNMHGQTCLNFAANTFRFLLPLHHV